MKAKNSLAGTSSVVAKTLYRNKRLTVHCKLRRVFNRVNVFGRFARRYKQDQMFLSKNM